jgi:hypothetical protein
VAKKQINMRLDEGLVVRLNLAAKAAGMDRTSFVERAIEGLLDDAARAPVGLPPRVRRARSAAPGIRTAAEVRADPVRAAGLARMAKLYDKG